MTEIWLDVIMYADKTEKCFLSDAAKHCTVLTVF